MTDARWDGARHVLAVRLDGVGDVLMTTPALRALRSVPGTRITLLASSTGARIARLVPEIDDVLVYDPPWMKHGARAGADEDRAVIDGLASRGFEGAIVFTTFSQSALPAAMACRLAGIPLRAAHCRENPYAVLTEWVPDPEPVAGIRHEVRRQLDLVASVGRRTRNETLSLAVPDAARARVEERLGDAGIAADVPWVVVHPGATAPSRRYPSDRFADVASRLGDEGIGIVFTGSRDERGDVEAVRSSAGCGTSLAGDLDLAELAVLLASAWVVVTNNSAPSHIAAAVGTPVVDLYAYTNPQHIPWGVPSRVLYQDVSCRNCLKSVCPMGHHACLRGVPAERVVSAVFELLAETSGRHVRAEDPRRLLSTTRG